MFLGMIGLMMLAGVLQMLLVAVIMTALSALFSSVIQSREQVYKLGHPPVNKGWPVEDIPFRTEHFFFSSADGLELAAIQYHPNGPPKGVILACHYLGGSKQSIFPYIASLLEHGFTVVAFDYPNHGESGSRRSSRYTLEKDMKRFLALLKKRGIRGPLGAIGFSMGATLAIQAACVEKEIRAVVLDSGPLLYVKNYFLYVLNNKKITNRLTRVLFMALYLFVIGFFHMSRRTKKRLKRLKGFPLLFIHGEKDRVIPIQNARTAYRLSQSEKSRLLSVKRSHHMTNRALLGEDYDKLVVEFFEKWLTEE